MDRRARRQSRLDMGVDRIHARLAARRDAVAAPYGRPHGAAPARRRRALPHAAPELHTRQLRSAYCDAQPRRHPPQRRPHLRRHNTRSATRPPRNKYRVLYHKRRPHRPRHRPNTHAARPRGSARTYNIRRSGFLAARAAHTPRYAPRGGRGGALRPPAFPLPHAVGTSPQPPQTDRDRRPHCLSGRDKHREPLCRRRQDGILARRAHTHRGRRGGAGAKHLPGPDRTT